MLRLVRVLQSQLVAVPKGKDYLNISFYYGNLEHIKIQRV